MSKPKLKNINGYWMCTSDKIIAGGITPEEAFYQWKSSKAALLWENIKKLSFLSLITLILTSWVVFLGIITVCFLCLTAKLSLSLTEGLFLSLCTISLMFATYFVGSITFDFLVKMWRKI